MRKQSKWMVSLICLFIGFMAAVQFQTTTAEPEARETRDEWEIREDLLKQQETQQELLEKIETADATLKEYEEESKKEQLQTLKESIEILEKRAGLTEVEGAGVILTIAPIFLENMTTAQVYPIVTPELMNRLINELNTYGAEEIAIGNERVVNLSPVRNVNGSTYINNRPLPALPLTIKVLTEQPELLKNYMEVSEAKEMFAIENMEIQAEVKNSITLPAYQDPLHLEILEGTGE